MAIDKIQTAGLGENIEIGGTEAARMPQGTTAQRANVQAGDIRFNSTLSLMEYYTGIEWKSIDSPPTVTSLSPTTIVDGTTVTVTGSNFQSGVNITIIGSDGTTYTPDSIVRTNNTTVTFDATAAMISGSLDYFDVKITNTSNLSATLENALEIASTHTWATAAGSLGTIYDSARSGHTFNAGSTYSGGESDVTVTHSISSGTLPSGLSINASTGAITGSTSAVGSDTTTNITVQYSAADASAGTTVTGTRNFSLVQKAPVVTSYTSTGSGTFTVPTGIASVDVLAVAGGGGGGDNQGAGGAGGLIYRPAFPVTPGGSISYTVGGGASGSSMNNAAPQITGQDSTFGTLTAKGGGSGGSEYGPGPQSQNGSNGSGYDGGSGGGGCYPNGAIGNATQPSQPGDSGTYGFGNNGGTAQSSSPYATGAGGGAAAVGQQASPSGDAAGGIGKQYDISGSQVYYAGGGGGGATTSGSGGSGGQGGGGNGGKSNPNGSQKGQDGQANRGGGGGSNGENAGGGANNGGSGIVIVKY